LRFLEAYKVSRELDELKNNNKQNVFYFAVKKLQYPSPPPPPSFVRCHGLTVIGIKVDKDINGIYNHKEDAMRTWN